MLKRIIADVVLFFSIFFAPWWVTIVLGALSIIFLPMFWEAVLVGMFLDAMYGGRMEGIYGRFGFFTVIALILVIASGRIKKQIRI